MPTDSTQRPASHHPHRWLPEFWELGRKRLRPQVRVLGLSLLVGVLAGLGAIVFYLACQFVVRFSLDAVAGYQPHHPGGEPPLFGQANRAFTPWLLVIVPGLDGIVSGWLVVWTTR